MTRVFDLAARALFAPEGVAAAVADAVEDAGERAADAIEAAEEAAEEAIEQAADDVAAAQKAADDLARAALLTELGRQVAEATERVEQCRNELQSELATVRERLTTAEAKLAELSTQPPAAVVIPAQPAMEEPLTLPPLVETATPPAAVVIPATVPEASGGNEGTPLASPARKRNRWI